MSFKLYLVRERPPSLRVIRGRRSDDTNFSEKSTEHNVKLKLIRGGLYSVAFSEKERRNVVKHSKLKRDNN
jgi:hypothetical protein